MIAADSFFQSPFSCLCIIDYIHRDISNRGGIWNFKLLVVQPQAKLGELCPPPDYIR